MSSKKFCLFAVLLGLFMAGYAFAQGSASGESDGAIQIFIAALNEHLGAAANFLFSIFFFDFGLGLPLIVIVLTGGGIYYSFYFGWITFRGFRHSLNVIRGRYDHPDHPGEISHFKALTSALSATVGLGNIAGVAIAVSAGGPGAVFLDGRHGLFWYGFKAGILYAGGYAQKNPSRWPRVGWPDVLSGARSFRNRSQTIGTDICRHICPVDDWRFSGWRQYVSGKSDG